MACLVYMTTATAAEARSIGRALVKEHLAACINIIAGMQAVYRWQGELMEENETVLIAKTGYARLPALIERVRELHSYEIPCIVSLPIENGNPDFLKWIEDQTAP